MNERNIFPDDDNGDVLRRMQKNGDDFSISRDVDFTVVFSDERSARKFQSHFEAAGYGVSVKSSGTVPELPWDVVVVKHMLPKHSDITDFEKDLEAVAEPLGGRNDGWGCFEQPEPQGRA